MVLVNERQPTKCSVLEEQCDKLLERFQSIASTISQNDEVANCAKQQENKMTTSPKSHSKHLISRWMNCICQRDPEVPHGGVSGRSYKALLQEQLPVLMGPSDTFQQDNAPIHKFHEVTDWLWDSGYRVLEFPPYSPDLTSIEHNWFPLKQNHRNLQPLLHRMPVTTAKQLIEEHAPTAWQMILQTHMNSLIDLMPHRIEAVIAAEGWYTHY